VGLHDLATGKRQHTFLHSDKDVDWPSAKFSRDGSRLATGDNQNVRLWDFKTRQMLWEQPTLATFIAFDPDGQSLLTGSVTPSDKALAVKRWEISTGKELGSIIVGIRFDFP